MRKLRVAFQASDVGDVVNEVHYTFIFILTSGQNHGAVTLELARLLARTVPVNYV